jgi:hypothetical protein
MFGHLFSPKSPK